MPPGTEDFALDKWLDEVTSDDKDLTAEEKGALLKLMSREKVSAKVRGSVLKEADYRQKTQGLAEQRRAFEADQAKLAEQKQTLETWREGVQAQLDDSFSKYENAKLSAAQLRAKVEMIAERNGLKVEDLLGPEGQVDPTVTPTKGPAAGIDPAKFVSKDDFDAWGKRVGAMGVLGDAEIGDLAEEHAQIFGKPLRDEVFKVRTAQGEQEFKGRTGLVRAALASGRPLREYWSENFKVQDKQWELREARARADERQKAESDFRAKFGSGEPGDKVVFMDEQSPRNPAQTILMGKDKGEPQQGVPSPPRDRVANALAFHRERLAKGEAWKEPA